MAEEPLAEKDAEEKQIPPKSEASSTQKLSHKQWRAKLRREKRKIRRQEIAKVVASTEQKDFENEADSEEERLREQRDEAERAYLNRLWLEREQKAMQEWKWKKEQEERDRLKREEQERKIKEEWEERQKKEQEENEEQERKNKEKKSKQDDLLRQATANENKEGDGPWHNPIVTTMPGRERDKCPFFAKTGACRFGDRCSRVHPQPESSTVLLFRGMYSHFELQQGLHDEYDTDLILEYEDSELYQNFRDFYEDIVPEFKAIGKVVQVKVCCNYEPHLRGNVYVQYKREEDTASALMKFNGRFYAGKQLSCEFVDIVNWKSAVCGLFGSGRCPKGKNCNFLHVFKNPNNEFWDADRRQFNRSRSRSPYQNRSYRRYSRSRTHRSRSRSRRHSKSRSRSRSRDRYYSSKSRRRRRSRTRSYSRSRSRSNSRERRPQERKKSKDYDSKLKTKDYSSRSDSSRRYSYSRSDSKPREDYSRSESKPNDQRSRSENKSQDSVSKIDEINGTESSNGSKHYGVKYTEEAIEKGLSEILAMSKNGAEKHESDKYDREDSDHSNSPVSCKHKKHKSHKHKKHKRSSRD